MLEKFFKWFPQLQLVLFAIAGSVTAIVSLLDLIGLIDSLAWFAPNLGKITLFLVSVILLEVLFQRELVNKIESLTQRVQARDFSDMQHQVDPKLREIFGDKIVALIESAVDAVVNRTVRVEGMSYLRPYYNKTLEVYAKHTFWATSVPSEAYYWKPGTYEAQIREFIAGGGIIERIFYIDGETPSEGEKRVISVHLDLGVRVYFVPEVIVPSELKRLFLVESHGLIGWESFITHTKEIRSSIVMTDHRFTENLRTTFQQIKGMSRRAVKA